MSQQSGLGFINKLTELQWACLNSFQQGELVLPYAALRHYSKAEINNCLKQLVKMGLVINGQPYRLTASAIRLLKSKAATINNNANDH